MIKLILFCSVLVLATAKPNYTFQTGRSYSSSSDWVNNELQHKNADASFYSNDGMTKPKSTSFHVQYTNPKLLRGSNPYQTGGYSGGGAGIYDYPNPYGQGQGYYPNYGYTQGGYGYGPM